MTQDQNDTQDRRLDERLRRLPPELPPARDLWPAIAARLENASQPTPAPPRRRPAWPLLALAASVTVAAVLVVNLLHRDAPLPPGAVPDTAQPTAQHVAPTAPFGPAHELGGDYQAARAGLVDDLEQRLANLDPEARAAVLANLETIRRAVAEINAALGDDPASVLLQNQLLATYQDELAVLANLQRVTGRLPTRNDL
ncbi:MAG TPA: hypothetical protein PLI48_06620 [Gammaproteobacteria bacterium]|nr:hypothetical protein [Gammaproteobacteria bacterium]